jgi:hypothetical protein
VKNQDYMGKTNFFLAPALQPLGNFSHMATCRSSSRKYNKNELNIHFEQNFTMGSYKVSVGRTWCSRKACEICSSLVQKKRLKKNYFSSHKLPKQHSTSFWSQGILGVNCWLATSMGLQYIVHSALFLLDFDSKFTTIPVRTCCPGYLFITIVARSIARL